MDLRTVLALLVPGVGHVEDHPRREIEPHDLGGIGGVSREESELGGHLRVKDKGKPGDDHFLGPKEEGHVQKDGVPFGERHVVHHRRTVWQVNGNALDEVSLCIEDPVGQVGGAVEVVTEEVHLPRLLIHLGVGGELFDLSKWRRIIRCRWGIRPSFCLGVLGPSLGRFLRGRGADGGPADGLDGAAAEDLDDVREVHLVEGEDLVSVESQVGVGLARALRQIEDAEPCLELLADEGEEAALAGELADLHENGAAVGSLLLETGRLDPPVGVERLAVFQPNAVDHAVAVEPVVLAEGLVEGVRTVP